MEIDDQSFSPPKEASPQLHRRRLKRLKKTIDTIDAAPSEPTQADFLASSVGLTELETLERSETVNKEHSPDRSNPENFDADNELNFGLLLPVVDRKEAKRSLDFGAENDDVDENFVDRGEEEPVEGNAVGDSDVNVSKAKKRTYSERKGKNKKGDKSEGNDVKPKISSSNKRREEKERRVYLQQLHVESQKLLRETSGAAFKPIPIVHKPIGSVLEKIRQRKLEMLKKTASTSVNSLNNTPSEGLTRDHDPSDLTQFQRVDKSEEVDGEELEPCCADMKKTSSDETDMDVCKLPESSSKEGKPHLQMQQTLVSSSSSPIQANDEQQSLLQPRAPLDDTEDLFCNYQNTEDNDEIPHGQQSTLEETLGPSPLLMQLKFDSALSNDSSSDEEEDNDKENIIPDVLHGSTSVDGDLLRKFVDDEAVEEDDSDNDIRFQEDEDDEIDDYEDLKDLIATGFKEEKVDIEKRNELHQKWLEQQDSFGTDNLLQKLGCGSKVRESTTLLEEEEDEEDETSGDDAAEDLRLGNLSKGKKKKMKLMIPEMFPDKEECYISDDETERDMAKQRFLIKAEKEVTLLPPIQDENSRDVFGLIKKVNTVGDAKKNVKTSFLDKLLIAGNSNSSSKSSFLGRASSHSLPAANKKGLGTARSFIFSRDDSNSRSSIGFPAEDSSEAVQAETEIVLRKKVTSKFSGSQSKTSSSQKMSISMMTTSKESVSNPSLLDMLKIGPKQSEVNMVGLTQTALAAFKIRKRPFKTEARK